MMSHLQDLTPDELLQRRVEVTGSIKHLEIKHLEIKHLEIKHLEIKQRSRPSWDDPHEARDAVKSLQTQAKKDGPAEPLTSVHPVMIQAST
jgi:hypothetical protein